MPVSFDKLKVGGSYSRPELAKLWGYRGWSAIGRGIVTPAGENLIILFITKEKQDSLPQYQDSFDGETLCMDGEDGHASDNRIILSSERGDQVHLFFRERHHLPFTYEGLVVLDRYTIRAGVPARFAFKCARAIPSTSN